MTQWTRTADLWPIDKILPYDRNAKLHDVERIMHTILVGMPPDLPPDQQQAYILDKLIDQPIVVDGSGVILKGHGRRKAAIQLGLTEFPVIVRTDLTPEEARLVRIADNLSGEGGYDADVLSTELSALMASMPEMDFDGLGINMDWLHTIKVTTPTEIDIDGLFVDDTGGERQKQPKIITCPSCGEEFEA